MEKKDELGEIKKWYKQWCKDTKRGGSTLIGPSIQELLKAFKDHLIQKSNTK